MRSVDRVDALRTTIIDEYIGIFFFYSKRKNVPDVIVHAIVDYLLERAVPKVYHPSSHSCPMMIDNSLLQAYSPQSFPSTMRQCQIDAHTFRAFHPYIYYAEIANCRSEYAAVIIYRNISYT